MLLIKLYYWIFAAFVYALVGFYEAFHGFRKLKEKPYWKWRVQVKNNFISVLRLHHEAGQ